MKSNRIIYIDCLRAFAIFCVVLQHIYWFALDRQTDSICYQIIVSFFMPLFFFISGIFAKNNMSIKSLCRKASSLLIPFFTVGSLYSIFHGASYLKLFFDNMHNGFWFLPTLFFMFVLFLVRCIVYNKIIKIYDPLFKKLITEIILLALLYIVVKSISFFLPLPLKFFFCTWHVAANYIYFVLGFCVFFYKEHFVGFFSKYGNHVYTVCLLLSVLCFFLKYLMYIVNVVLDFTLAMAINVVLFYLFSSLPKNKFSAFMGKLGSYTLHIYVCHYFFLPSFKEYYPSFMGGYDIFIVIMLAMLVISITMLVVKIIERSVFLNYVLFGKHNS